MVDPLDALAVVGQPQRVAAGGAAALEEGDDLLREHRVVDDDRRLGVAARRASVHVHRANGDPALVDDDQLGVQPPQRADARRAGFVVVGAFAHRHQLVQGDAELEQVVAIARVAEVHERLVGGGQRIGHDHEADVVRARFAQGGQAVGAGNEVG